MFLFRFGLLAIPFYVIIEFSNSFGIFKGLQILVAEQTASLLRMFGFAATTSGWLVKTQTAIVEIVPECTAWRDMVAFLGLTLAVPEVKLMKRLKAVLFIPVIYGVNLVRLTTTIAAITLKPEWGTIVHNVLWKEGMLIFILLLWFYWWKSK